jgi:hypothetical protein
MKKFLYYALLPLCMLAATGCKKDTTTPTGPTGPIGGGGTEPKRWVKVYKDVIIANETNTGQGQFLNTRTGASVKLADAVDSVRKQLSLVCFISSGGNYVYLTAPGSLFGAVLNSDHSRTIFTATPNGLNNWTPVQQNTSLIRPVVGGMDATAFDKLATTATWPAFNEGFKNNNKGEENLAFVLSYEFAGSGDIFLVQINGALRMILKATSVNNDPTNGFIRADVIVEGREDMATAGRDMMPLQ